MSSFVDSKKKKLSEEEIVKIAAKESAGKYTADQIKASLSQEAYKLKSLMMREGNTIFVVHQSPTDGTIAMVRAVNADTVPNYMNNCVVFAKAIGMAGFKTLVAQFSGSESLPIFKYVYRKAPFPNMGYKVQKCANGDYMVTINLGDTHKGSK